MSHARTPLARAVCVVAALLATLFVSPSAADADSALPKVVTTASGQIRGHAPDNSGVTSYQGIPYAAPPTGALRWRPPQPAPSWSGVRDATSPGHTCFGIITPSTPLSAMSEDCLTLNVWAPTADVRPKAVMVWLHGGGFQFGSGSEPGYDGARLAAKGVVVVTLNYRLGVFGFLARHDLDAESGPSGDLGLQDQIAALRWVQSDIAAFGGDPDRVTVFGESAGAHSVGILMSSPTTTGLFQRAIAESGAFWDSVYGSIDTHAMAMEQGDALSATLHAPTLAALRAIPPNQLNAATARLDRSGFQPSIDGAVVPDPPARVFTEGRQQHVPLLAGYMAEEDYPVFDNQALPHKPPPVFDLSAAQVFGQASMDAFKQRYPSGTVSQTDASAKQLAGDMMITEQTWEMLGLHARTSGEPVYGYKFTYTSPYTPRAGHTADLPFVFGNLDPRSSLSGSTEASDADRAFSDEVMAYWTAFARTGDPNTSGLPAWAPYQGQGSPLQELAATPSQIPDPDEFRLRFLASFREDGRLPDTWRAYF
ncbi:carboxylesterase/lipase family protein [Streptomyces sp. NBC_00687]|uniref:carboxylesterase/lipase family protein n=1 Tax=Streptomyces sp. NBC_00687 TaxID=2975807 RepID=UPI0022545488|nr:carboxylesterase family protein [Streptomyces sp. NBC_00687]MCX4919035.1 carboxylesterase family protein [Streptomyces sp. NBC_00687]